MNKLNLLPVATTLLLAAALNITSGCKKKDKLYRRANIEYDQDIKVARKTIPVSGGEIVIDEPGNPLDGMRIEVPENAYDEDQQFSVSYADIKNYDCGPYFNPLTPLITVSNDGTVAQDLIKLTIPVRIPKGHFAMAFFYNEETGRLDPMQPDYSDEEENNNYLTTYTLNFSYPGEGDAARTGSSSNNRTIAIGGGDRTRDPGIWKIIVSSVDEKLLKGRHMTKFKPGVDDWQFVNWGSYIAPKGQCEGQSIGMLWYYSEKKLNGSPPLFGRFDNDGNEKTPDTWQDDVLGYRFCAMLQPSSWDLSLGNATNNILSFWQGKDDNKTRKAFAYALVQTDEPQFVAIYPGNGSSGHAMVVYGIDQGTLFIADPNFPGIEDRRIWFDEYNKSYHPYLSGDNARMLGKQYTIIHYEARTALSNWSSAPDYWREVARKTIGKDKFPEYTLRALNENDEFVDLTDEFVVTHPEKLLTLNLRSNWPGKFQVFGPFIQEDFIVRPTSDKPELRLGVCITDTANQWVDFKWVTVKYKKGRYPDPGPEKGSEGPLYGDNVRGNMEVNGTSVNLAEGIFSVGGESFGLNLKTDMTMDESRLKIDLVNWKGVGEYTITKVQWLDHNLTGGGIFSIKDNTGKLRITNWSPGKLEGSFSITVTEDNVLLREPLIKTIKGSFLLAKNDAAQATNW